MRCQEHSAQHIRKSESDSGRLNFKVYLLFLACHLPIASVILVGQMNKMRDHFLIYTLRRCYIWVHPFFLWFTAGSLDTSDSLSRTFCATRSQVRIRFKNVKFNYLDSAFEKWHDLSSLYTHRAGSYNGFPVLYLNDRPKHLFVSRFIRSWWPYSSFITNKNVKRTVTFAIRFVCIINCSFIWVTKNWQKLKL